MKAPDSLLVGDRSERQLHPGTFLRDVYVRPAIHPDPSPLPVGAKLRDDIARIVEEHLPYVRRQGRRIARQVMPWVIAAAIGTLALIAVAQAWAR